MKPFDNGVRYYTKATVEFGFPEDDICCYRCPLMGKDLGVDREICRKTGEILPAPRHTIGYDCPLKFKSDDSFTVKDKLIDLLEQAEGLTNNEPPTLEQMADFLIDHGVVISKE